MPKLCVVPRYTTKWVQVHLLYFFTVCLFIVSIRTPQTFPDSASYRSARGEAPWAWISFTGKGYARGWPIELFYSIFNTDLSRAWMQSLIHFISVIFVSFAVFVRFDRTRFGFRLSLLIIFIGQLGIVQGWNNYISRESLSNSLLAICLGVFILSGKFLNTNRGHILLLVQATVATTAIILKPTFFPILLTIFGVQLLQLIRFRNLPKSFRIEKKLILTSIASLLLLAYASINASNQNIGWSNADPEARTLEEISFSYVISEFNPSSQSFIRFLELRKASDKCSLPKNSIRTINLGEPMIYAGVIRKLCPDFSSYVKSDYKSDYVRFLIANPTELVSTVSTLSRGSFSFMSEGLSRSLVQSWVGQVLLLDIPFITNHFIFFCLFTPFSLVVLTFFRRRDPQYSSLLARTSTVLMFIGSGLISIIFSVLFQPTHIGDLSRQSFSTNLFIRLSILWLLIDFVRVLYQDFRVKSRSKS